MWPMERSKKQHGLRKLRFLFDILYFSSLFRTLPYMWPWPFFLTVITKAWLWRAGPLSILHDQHMKYSPWVTTWIGELLDLNLAEKWPFLSARWHFDNVFCFGTFGEQIIPSSSHKIHLAFKNFLKITTQSWLKSTVDLRQWRWLGTQLENLPFSQLCHSRRHAG